jgi:uncharacterized membrane protein affecting hemolysin expression
MTQAMSLWLVVIISVLGTVIVCIVAGLLLSARRSYRRTETLLVDRSLSRLPDESSYELWRDAADQSQEVSDQRRNRRW